MGQGLRIQGFKKQSLFWTLHLSYRGIAEIIRVAKNIVKCLR